MPTNWKKKYEDELARANRNAVAFHQLARNVKYASDLAGELDDSIRRDCLGLHMPPYLKLAILAVKNSISDAYMQSIREAVK